MDIGGQISSSLTPSCVISIPSSKNILVPILSSFSSPVISIFYNSISLISISLCFHSHHITFKQPTLKKKTILLSFFQLKRKPPVQRKKHKHYPFNLPPYSSFNFSFVHSLLKMMRGEDQQSRLLYELCTLVLSILKSPQFPFSSPPFNSTTVSSSSSSSRRRPRQLRPTPQVSPAGFASLLLGVSLALMLCGSVTFVIGFLLMPWVLALIMVLYFVGIVSNLSLLGRAILCPPLPLCSSPPHMAMSPKEMSEMKLYEVAYC